MKINPNTPTSSLTVTSQVNFSTGRAGAKQLRAAPTDSVPAGHVPRVARLMALAIHFEELLKRGEVKDYADLARLGHVTRARITQIMNLLLLAPDIQEEILFLPVVEAGREPLKEWHVRPTVAEPVWGRQRRIWRKLMVR